MAFVEQFGDRSRMRRPGVTLIELVVVSAIISVLAVILVQGLSNARKQAWRIECAGNLRAVGNAFNFYAGELGRYPDTGDRKPRTFGTKWKRGDPKPPRISGLDNIMDLAEALVYHSLGDPRMFYCPTSQRNDPNAERPFKIERDSISGKLQPKWRNGKISYLVLLGVTDSYVDVTGRPTFDPVTESPYRTLNRLNSRAVLAGDRTVELLPKARNIPGSNHGREGGWFYFASGDVQWHPWKTLTAHPAPTNYIWYWPNMFSGTSNQTVATAAH